MQHIKLDGIPSKVEHTLNLPRLTLSVVYDWFLNNDTTDAWLR